MCYCNVIDEQPFLWEIAKSNLRTLAKLLKTATEKQLKTIIEIIYNSYDVPLTLKGRKLLSAHKKLIKYFHKNKSISLSKVREHLVSYKQGVQAVVSLILHALLEDAVLEACMTE